ncbi:hypothetical protein T484DRAFT_1903210, partial [Baffinella frigidus]
TKRASLHESITRSLLQNARPLHRSRAPLRRGVGRLHPHTHDAPPRRWRHVYHRRLARVVSRLCWPVRARLRPAPPSQDGEPPHRRGNQEEKQARRQRHDAVPLLHHP